MATKKPAAKKPPAEKVAKRPAAKPAAEKVAKRPAAKRADLGAPIDGFLEKQPAPLREIVDALRALIAAAAPDATATLKWGMPFFTVGGEMMCAIGAHKAHVNLILPGSYEDPGGLLEGDGKTGRHLKLRARADLPEKAVRGWLAVAAARARG